MAIPVVYNFRSVRARWTSAIVAVAGIAGTVGVFVAMLSLARVHAERRNRAIDRSQRGQVTEEQPEGTAREPAKTDTR